MNTKGAVAVIAGAAGGIGRALALELVKRKAAALALVDQSDAVHEIAKALNEVTGNPVAFGYSGDVSNEDFRRKVYQQMMEKSGRVNICVPAAGITRDSLAVKIEKETKKVSIFPIDTFRQVKEGNLVSPVLWAMESVSRIAEMRAWQAVQQPEPDGAIRWHAAC